MKELPKFTEGPWYWENDRLGQPNVMGNGGQLVAIIAHECVKPQEELEANAHIVTASPLLYTALWAQEIASEMTKALAMPDPNDPRYEPFLGPYDGYQAPEIRFHDFMVKRQQLRQEALKAARGE